MSASTRFDPSSSSPVRPLYASGQRGSYASASLDRSASFRENMENPNLSSLPNTTKSTSTITQTDVTNFFQCLRFDPKAMVSEHKLNRHSDFKRLTGLAVGMPVEDSPVVSCKGKPSSSPFPEEARRLKAGLRESCTKARERVKIFTESLSVINKCFPNIPSRKRYRSDVLSNERSNVLYSSDRAVSGAGIGKIGNQSGYQFELQKSEKRTKNAVPNKRTRTSMVDLRPEVQASTASRPSGIMDRDGEILRLPNGSTVQGEVRTSPIAVEGWEKSKMKKKRSGIKPDTTGSKPMDSHREPKQGLPSRLIADGGLRFSDTHGFRPGAATGNTGTGKADGVSQQVPLGMRSSMSKVDQDNGLHLIDRRDQQPIGSEKGRMKIRAIKKKTKAAVRENFLSATHASSTKVNSVSRAPRSVSGVAPKLSAVVQQAAVANDWETSHCTSRLPSAVGPGNRKRTTSMRSSSPPVAQWASQRPQKISRPARRANFPIVPNNDEIPPLDSTSDALSNERRLCGSSPQQVNAKSDHFSSAASESEESGAAEIKSKDKSNRFDELDEKSGPHVQKMSLLLPPRKSKRASGEDHGDGIRRQGRTGRGFAATRNPMNLMVEKLGNVGTAKQLRSSRHGLDKTESKAGRPPTRKLVDRKAYKRQKQASKNGATDFLVGSDDVLEDLLAAASAVTNTEQALSSSFWKQMEPLFRFISEVDITFLRQQVNHETTLTGPVSDPFDADGSSLVSDGFGLREFGGDTDETHSLESTLDHVVSVKSKHKDISLYQRVMAALIPEDLYCSGSEDLNSDSYQSGFEMEMNLESDTTCAQILYGSETSKYPTSNGYIINSSVGPFDNSEQVMECNNITSASDMGHFLNYDSQKCLLPHQQTLPGFVSSEYKYNEMSIDEKLLLEIHCIGIYPQSESDLAHAVDEEISVDMSRLDEKHQEMVSKKKEMLGKLLNSAANTREYQEKEFERHAFDKLVEMAYEKYMRCWGPNVHGAKSASGKMAKQAALTLVKRTLDRCIVFEETGKSCFREPLYKDMFLSAISRLSDGQTDSNTDSEAAKSYFSPLQSPSLNRDILYEGNLYSEASRVKRRELEDVLGTSIAASSGAVSGVGCSLSSSVKGKRSERDREGKGNGREASSRSGSIKIGRPASSNVKGERKPKTKAKLKTTQLSTSVNGLLGKMTGQHKAPASLIMNSSDVSASGICKDKNDYDLDELEDPIDLSGLQIPEMDVLGVPDDLDGQGQDIGSWLNIDDDGLQDHDFMGLEIPMDDLSELNMMV